MDKETITGPVAIDTGDFGWFSLTIGNTTYRFPAGYKLICPWTHEAPVEDYLRFLIDKARSEGIKIREENRYGLDSAAD